VTRRRRIYASRGKAEIEHKTVIGLTALRQWSLKGATVSRRGYLSALGSMLDRAEVDLVHIHGRTTGPAFIVSAEELIGAGAVTYRISALSSGPRRRRP
jgi:hypothetical protein